MLLKETFLDFLGLVAHGKGRLSKPLGNIQSKREKYICTSGSGSRASARSRLLPCSMAAATMQVPPATQLLNPIPFSSPAPTLPCLASWDSEWTSRVSRFLTEQARLFPS